MEQPSRKAVLSGQPWGAWCLVSLYLSVISGIVVALQFDPASPWLSTTAIDALVPFGAMFRSIHFYSSQAFFLLLIIHFVQAIDTTDTYPLAYYLRLTATLPTALLLLFTGYILRADSTGSSAGMIAESIVAAIPGIGGFLNNLLFSVTEHGMQRVYVHHLISFDLLLLVLAWDHLRRYRVRITDHLWLIFVTFGLCSLIAAPMEPAKLGVSYIAGPWFFLGLQELLRYLPPLLAGLVLPFSFMAALCCLQKNSPWYRSAARYTVACLLISLILSVIAETR